MTLDAYIAAGGVLGALARRAEELYGLMDKEQKEAVRQLFLRLVTLGEGAEDTPAAHPVVGTCVHARCQRSAAICAEQLRQVSLADLRRMNRQAREPDRRSGA